MITLSDLCRDIFFLAQIDIDGSGPVRGRLWEQRVADHLARHSVPSEPLPGGYSIFGHVSLSTLKHQIDGTLECTDAIVIGEWKAFRDKLPKNELLRFKAATDDYFMATWERGSQPACSKDIRRGRRSNRRGSGLRIFAWDRAH